MNLLFRYLNHWTGPDPRRWAPMLAVYYLTYRCSFRCPYCSDGQGIPYYRLAPDELPGEQAAAVLAAIRKNCSYLVLTGGEPTLYEALPLVLEQAAKLRFRELIFTTNGYEITPVLPQIASAVTSLVFSLDTLDETKADAWHGYGVGSLRRILANIAEASALPGRRFQIVISSVVTPGNIEDLYSVYDYARQRGFLFAACPQLVGVKAHGDLAGSERYRRFYDFLISEKRGGAAIHGTALYLEHMRDIRKFRCHPLTMLVVSPLGEVFYPCLEQGKPAGNLLDEDDLEAIRARGRSLYGDPPNCDNRCHSACALGFGLIFEHPWSMASEAALQLRNALRGFGRPSVAEVTSSSCSNPTG